MVALGDHFEYSMTLEPSDPRLDLTFAAGYVFVIAAIVTFIVTLARRRSQPLTDVRLYP